MSKNLVFTVVEGCYGICRLDRTQPLPDWLDHKGFVSITRTLEELSIVCPAKSIPQGITSEQGWKILKVEGPLDFSLIGVLASISAVLAQAKISIFVISTFDTDYILVKEADLDRAISALISQGYTKGAIPKK